jgi:protein involved in polysaccharide export with SLBB domain
VVSARVVCGSVLRALAFVALFCACSSLRLTSLDEIGARYRDDVGQRQLDYRIKPGDVLKVEISTLDPRDLDQAEVKVRADGRADLFFLPNHLLAGKTVDEVHADFAERVRAQIRDAEISIQVTSSSEKIYLVGQFERPGPFDLTPKMTLAEAVSAAGGMLITGDTDAAVLRRPYRDPESPDTFLIDLHDDAQLYLLPGDQIVLGRTWAATFVHFIQEYILFFLDFRIVYGITEP